MQKTDANTVLALIFLASAAIVIGGLAVIPALGGFQTVQAEPQPKVYCKTNPEGASACSGLRTNQDPTLRETNLKKHCREVFEVPGFPPGEGKCTRDKASED
jgi:hypothetical protein